jgi:single-strand DNA-binding protein
MSFHTIIIVGNLGKDPEMRYTPSGQPVTSFSVATSRSYSNQAGEKVDETIWFRVTAWGKLAETCNQYLRKGKSVLVEGRISPDKNGGPRVFTRQDGTSGSSYEVVASTVRFLGNRSEGGGEPMAEGVGGDGGGEDIPF